jgi:glycosyltransferase involved in cell wall biosynthesis
MRGEGACKMPRKVAYLTPLFFDEQSYLGGGERYPLNLARGVVVSALGRYEVELVSFGERAFREPIAPGITLRVMKACGRPRNPLDLVSWEMPDALGDADLVHIHQAYTRCAEVGILVAKHQRKPICISDHGGFASPLGADVGSLELVDRIVAYSNFGASFYRTTRPIHVIKGGVDADLFSPPPERPNRDRILYVGRLLPHKGIDGLIRATPPELPLTLCGRPYHEPYFQHLKSLAAGKQVEFVTSADDATIRDLYARSWVNVLPSVYRDCYGQSYLAPELMGFTLLEAMACATPAICSRVAAMPEFIRNGETGFIYDELDDLTHQLRLLAGNPRLVEKMGRWARETVLQEFDLKIAGARLRAVYDDLLGTVVEAAA